MDLEVIYEEARDRAEAEGAYSREEWNDIIDDILDGKRVTNQVHDDDDWAQIREALQARFEELEEETAEL